MDRLEGKRPVGRLAPPQGIAGEWFRALVLAGLPILLGACAEGESYQRLEGATMGTYYVVTSRCPGIERDALDTAVRETLARVNAQMSTYQPDSELSLFNGAGEGVWQPVSAELAEVLGAAAEIAELSGGAFDVTVGPLVNLWGFGPAGRVDAAPDEAAIAAARQRVGRQYLTLDGTRLRVRKDRALYVDLSAIAKGHGVDRLARTLDERGCTDYLVDIGGEVIGRGRSTRGGAWRVGIEVPDPERLGGVQRVIALADRAIATSGDYRNFIDLDGARLSHTVDPRTGRPVTHALASVSVVHPSAMWADGLATALNVLGPEVGYQLAEREGLAAFFLTRAAAGFEERYTAAMRAYLEAPK